VIPPESSGEDWSIRFDKEFEALGGTVSRLQSAAEVCEHLAELITSQGVTKIALSDAQLLADIKLKQRLADHFGPSHMIFDLQPDQDAESLKKNLQDVDLGITSCRFALAESGTFFLDATSEHNRLLSLLPPIHVLVLRPDQVVPGLGDALGAIRSEPFSHAVTLVTGPSRTADIEFTLYKGVHGPKEVHTVFLEANNGC
jgi:L-lactate dehydrogenase complex protein LldG